MSKSHILHEIKRTAGENGGVPLGRQRFFSETGIRMSDWYGRYWARWGDALREAGFEPNALQGRVLSDEQLLGELVVLIRKLGRYPTDGEIRIESRNNPAFPSHDIFNRRLGRKTELMRKLLKYCHTQGGHEDVVAVCRPLEGRAESEDFAVENSKPLGFVYLIKSGRYYKIGRTNAAGRREYEVGIQLPEKTALVHSIKTDDPAGIEAYWHHRFKDQRKGGEWFALTAQDVAAFRRRKFM